MQFKTSLRLLGGVGLGGVVESEDGCGLNVQTVVGKQLNGN